MQKHERAAQIWPVLALAAWNRQILTYKLLGGLIGVPPPGLGQLLEPIQSYCLANRLPALTSIVVGASGSPGTGFIAAADVPGEQASVFAHDWLAETVPSPDDLLKAAQDLPSCGVPEAARGDA